jgi:hypothetical protein
MRAGESWTLASEWSHVDDERTDWNEHDEDV